MIYKTTIQQEDYAKFSVQNFTIYHHNDNLMKIENNVESNIVSKSNGPLILVRNR